MHPPTPAIAGVTNPKEQAAGAQALAAPTLSSWEEDLEQELLRAGAVRMRQVYPADMIDPAGWVYESDHEDRLEEATAAMAATGRMIAALRSATVCEALDEDDFVDLLLRSADDSAGAPIRKMVFRGLPPAKLLRWLVRQLMAKFGPSAKLMDVLAALTGGPDKEAA